MVLQHHSLRSADEHSAGPIDQTEDDDHQRYRSQQALPVSGLQADNVPIDYQPSEGFARGQGRGEYQALAFSFEFNVSFQTLAFTRFHWNTA